MLDPHCEGIWALCYVGGILLAWLLGEWEKKQFYMLEYV